jgi:hypothetical protein
MTPDQKRWMIGALNVIIEGLDIAGTIAEIEDTALGQTLHRLASDVDTAKTCLTAGAATP